MQNLAISEESIPGIFGLLIITEVIEVPVNLATLDGEIFITRLIHKKILKNIKALIQTQFRRPMLTLELPLVTIVR